jgi:hypothetical protein
MCSLTEAFNPFVDPRNEQSVVSQSALFDDPEKKRRKKRRAHLPPEEPLVVEPDRPANRPMPPEQILTGSPPSNTQTRPSEMLNALESAEYFPHPTADSADKNVYKLEPDWATAFQNLPTPDWIQSKLPKENTENMAPLVSPSPWMDGMPTLWQKVPKHQQNQINLSDLGVGNSRLDNFQQRLDEMFKKLESMENSKTGSNLPEILLFVLGGIFLILLLDILVKQGTQASILLATAGGGHLYKRYMPFRQLPR